MGTINAVLKKSPVFAELEEGDRQMLETLFEKRKIHVGESLSSAGEPAKHFFLLGKGVLLLGMNDGKAVVADCPGDFVGLELLSAFGICHTDTTVLEAGHVYVIPRDAFLELIQEDSKAATIIMESWRKFLDKTAPFADIIDKIDL